MNAVVRFIGGPAHGAIMEVQEVALYHPVMVFDGERITRLRYRLASLEGALVYIAPPEILLAEVLIEDDRA